MPKNDNKKAVILETALNLFATHGFASTPISLIAEKAKVSQGLMYNFFDSKEALLKALLQMGTEDIAHSMEAYQQPGDPKEAIRNHVEKTVEIITQKKAFWKLLHAIRLQGGVIQSVQKEYAATIQQVTKVFENVFKKLKWPEPKLEAILFLTQIDGLVILYLQDERTPIKKLAQQIIKRYIK